MRITLSLIYYVAWWIHAACSEDCTLVGEEIAKQTEILKRLEPIKGKIFNVTDETRNYTYTIGICKGTGFSKVAATVGAVQFEKNNASAFHGLGLYDKAEVTGGSEWIFLKYMGGDTYHQHCGQRPRQAHILVICDHAGKGTILRVIEEHKLGSDDPNDPCYYLFELNTPIVCEVPPVPQDTLSGGSIFCIIFFTILGIYLIIGFLYQRIVVGAKGLEQIPNYNFWKDFGQLQADGCDFVCRCGERQDAKMYRGIDDQLLNPEPRDDRDDRLLPM